MRILIAVLWFQPQISTNSTAEEESYVRKVEQHSAVEVSGPQLWATAWINCTKNTGEIHHKRVPVRLFH